MKELREVLNQIRGAIALCRGLASELDAALRHAEASAKEPNRPPVPWHPKGDADAA